MSGQNKKRKQVGHINVDNLIIYLHFVLISPKLWQPRPISSCLSLGQPALRQHSAKHALRSLAALTDAQLRSHAQSTPVYVRPVVWITHAFDVAAFSCTCPEMLGKCAGIFISLAAVYVLEYHNVWVFSDKWFLNNIYIYIYIIFEPPIILSLTKLYLYCCNFVVISSSWNFL